MLASTASDVPVGDEWTFEPKYDGIRVLAFATRDGARLITRNGIDRAPQFPETVKALMQLARRRRRPFVLDGELISRHAAKRGASSFQALQSRWQVGDQHAVARLARESPVDLMAFDLLVEGKQAIIHEPWSERRVRLERLLTKPLPTGLRLGETKQGDGAKLLERAARAGWEGLIAKRVDALYRPGVRTRDWIKLKIVTEQEFVVGGWTEPRRSREHFGSLLLGYWKDGQLIYAGHTGTGFTHATLRDVQARLTRLERPTPAFANPPRTNEPAHWTEPKIVVVVRFTEWTAGGHLRQPVFMGVRDDKEAADVGREPMSMQKRVPRGAKVERASSSTRTSRSAAKEKSVVEQLEHIERGGGKNVIDFGARRTLEVTNLDKVYFPKARLTKGHVMRYYAATAPLILPLIADRPLVLKRFPDGLTKSGSAFFQQSAPDHTPGGVRVERVHTADGIEPRLVGGDLATLLYCVQIGALEVNPWHSRIGSLNYADYTILDLDPGRAASFAAVVHAALWIREVMDALGIAGVVKTSGGRGMHVYLPLPARTTFKAARTVADIIAHHVHAAHPAETTLLRPLKDRPPNAVYLDVGQNDRGKSVAAAFSLRAREPAPVSTPLDWDELNDRLDPRSFTIDSVLPDVQRRAELWRAGLRRPIRLERLTRSGTGKRAKSARRSRSAA